MVASVYYWSSIVTTIKMNKWNHSVQKNMMISVTIKCMEFTCKQTGKNLLESVIEKAADTASKKTVNAFQELMAGGCTYPDFKITKWVFFFYPMNTGALANIQKKH